MNNKELHHKKIKNITVASCVPTAEEGRFFLERKEGFYDPFLNQKLVEGFRILVEKLKNNGIDMNDYRITHRFIGSSSKNIPRDTIDRKVKKSLIELLESNGVYPYTT